MKYDIVSIKRAYRGMARSLLATDLITTKSEKYFDVLLDMYYKYISFIEETATREIFKELTEFYALLLKYDIDCEVIAYDVRTLKNVYDYPVEFLGVDIVHDECESLLENRVEYIGNRILNKNGLCNNKTDAIKLISLLDHGDVEWIPYYIYKIIL